MKNTLYIIGSIAFAGLIVVFIVTMLSGPLPPVQDLSLDQNASIATKRAQIEKRAEDAYRKSLSDAEIKQISNEFSKGKGASYQLSKEQEELIMKAINN